MSKLKILFMSGSLRKESFNTKFMHVAANFVQKNHSVEFISSKELDLPLINQDTEKEKDKLEMIERFTNQMNAVDAIVISTPEYNGSISSVLKNFLDWTSRAKKPAWTLKPVLLLAASPGGLGGIRGLAHARVPIETLGALVYPEIFGLAKAHEAFKEDGSLIDPKNQERLEALVTKFLTYTEKNATGPI
jgi:chromate reductase